MPPKSDHYDAIVIGSGFGGSMTGLSLARKFKWRQKKENILMLERGTWWTTPVGTAQDKEVKTYTFLKDTHKQPVQFWSAVDHFKGIIDLLLRCVRHAPSLNRPPTILEKIIDRLLPKNVDGLYDLTTFGRTGLRGILGGPGDGVTVLRASAVGGGSLVYANVTIRPPDFVLEDPQWPLSWAKKSRDTYFELARHAIGYGIRFAWTALEKNQIPYDGAPLRDDPINTPINTGLSNIVTRSARLTPYWRVKAVPYNSRGIRQIAQGNETVTIKAARGKKQTDKPLDANYGDWLIDRARVFQTAMSKITQDYGTVDSSINDVNPEPDALHPRYIGKNYCERQGRCILGCLPGARHTLNKQLMRAILGDPAKPENGPWYPDMELEALAEVDVIEHRPGGGYTVHYLKWNAQQPWRMTWHNVTAERVIVAAGCVGTNEIMLRSKERGTLPNLSDRVGFGFSTNGDYLAFLSGTKERVSLTRGPVTTSFGHFNTPESVPSAPGSGARKINPAKFHTIEDNGIPKTFSSLLGQGLPLLRSLSRGHRSRAAARAMWAIFAWFLTRYILQLIRAVFWDARRRADLFKSEEEITANIMCIAAMGRDAADGQFRLGKRGETSLRVSRKDHKKFQEDPIYISIKATLDKFAQHLRQDDKPNSKFNNPFFKLERLTAPVALSHPLGGCRMAKNAAEGVVDEYGRVFDKSKSGRKPFYEGLYIADASIIPTALGVNPSLTISALSLRIAKKIIDELPPVAPSPPLSPDEPCTFEAPKAIGVVRDSARKQRLGSN